MERHKTAQLALLIACLLGLAPANADAAATPAAQSPRTTATLITDSDSVAPGHPVRIGLRLHLAAGWHTYWQNPGDAGAAPTFDLTLPSAAAGPIAWPTPARQAEGPLTTYGYSGDLLLARTVTPPATGGLTIAAHATWLVCKDICVPEEASFALSLPPGPATPSREAPLFADAADQTPRPAPFTATLIPRTDGHQARLLIRDPALAANVQAAWFIPATEGQLSNSADQPLSVKDDRLELGLTYADGAHPGPLPGILVLHDGSGHESGYSLNLTIGPPEPGDAEPPALLALLGLAFLGGLILNLMPCVFPILAMKAIGLARLSGAARGQVRLQTLFYAAGILVSFAALAAVTIGFRGAGIAAGWGFQFQSPIFVTAIAWVMFVLGLSLSGVIRLPGGTWAGMGQGLTQRPGHFGSFFTGLLAVLVATPCTAPFMGAAIAGTLSTTAPITLLIFLTIGLGLASPTLLLLAAPHAADWLPRPGRWMETLRQALAFPMYGAAVWLVWVVSLQAGPPGVLASLAGMLVLALGAWARNAATGAGKLGNILAAAALLGAAAILTGVTTQPAAPTALAARQAAEPFTPARLAALRAEGRPVFVNMTAAWCVTCLINERLALSPPAVRDAFAARHVAYLLGDWTRQDPAITRYLNEQGRDGVPLYIFYPAGGGAPVVLPQLLTAATVLHQVVAGG